MDKHNCSTTIFTTVSPVSSILPTCAPCTVGNQMDQYPGVSYVRKQANPPRGKKVQERCNLESLVFGMSTHVEKCLYKAGLMFLNKSLESVCCNIINIL